MQAFAFNIRRDKFKDARVRRAFNFAFDFEEMNRTIFYGQYKRIASYFEGTELASSGIPQGKELEILQSVKDKVPADLFSKPYTNPVGGSQQADRDNLREALALFREAGYEIRNTKLTNVKTGEPFSFEFLVDDPATERFVLFYKPSLQRVGMTVNVRVVDSAQYENRLRQWDFDIIVASWGKSLSPGNEQRGFWSSQAADIPGSRNLIGIKNPAVDTLIERVIYAKDRDELVAATKALDRVLLWNFYVVPQWTYGKQRTARWDRFGHPQNMPKYGLRRSRPSGGGTRTRRPRCRSGLDHPSARACVIRGRDRRGEIHVARRARKTPSAMACPPSAISPIRRISRTSTTSIRTRPKAASFRRSARAGSYNRLVPHLQFAQQLHPQGRGRARAWISPSPP